MFWNEKQFEKQSQSHSQTHLYNIEYLSLLSKSTFF